MGPTHSLHGKVGNDKRRNQIVYERWKYVQEEHAVGRRLGATGMMISKASRSNVQETHALHATTWKEQNEA